MRRYFDGFLEMADRADTGFVLDTATWRGTPIWADKLGRSEADLLRLSRDAVDFARDIRSNWSDRVADILVNGVIGPAGDGYEAGTITDAKTAQRIHTPQIQALAASGVDMISAITMTGIPEAVGIARAAQAEGLPSVISFTVETDGRLPSGDLLGEAIEAVDRETGAAPAYYMVNCAHPDHFRDTLASGSGWPSRIGGVRANATQNWTRPKRSTPATRWNLASCTTNWPHCCHPCAWSADAAAPITAMSAAYQSCCTDRRPSMICELLPVAEAGSNSYFCIKSLTGPFLQQTI